MPIPPEPTSTPYDLIKIIAECISPIAVAIVTGIFAWKGGQEKGEKQALNINIQTRITGLENNVNQMTQSLSNLNAKMNQVTENHNSNTSQSGNTTVQINIPSVSAPFEVQTQKTKSADKERSNKQ